MFTLSLELKKNIDQTLKISFWLFNFQLKIDLFQSDVESRVLAVCKAFDKISADKVNSSSCLYVLYSH